MLTRRLEERYAKNGRRRGLVYALRRRQSPGSFRSRWDCLCNEVDHHPLLADNLAMTLWVAAGMHVACLAADLLVCCTRDAGHTRCFGGSLWLSESQWCPMWR